MSSCLDAIFSRCSVRRLEDRPLPREVVEEVVRAGIRAPNASAAEQWFFVVVESEEKRREVYELLIEAHVYYASRVRGDWGPQLRGEVEGEDIKGQGLLGARVHSWLPRP